MLLLKDNIQVFTCISKIKQGIKRRNGKNNQGRTTVWHRGNGNKIRLIQTNFNLNKVILKNYKYIKSDILHIFTNKQNKSAQIAYIKCFYKNQNNIISKYTSIINQKNLTINSHIYNYINKDINNWQINYNQIKVGNILCLKNIPVGTLINNIELHQNKGSQLIRAAGTYSQIIKKNKLTKQIYIKLRSGKIQKISCLNTAIIGINSNSEHKIQKKSKASDNRILGIRSHVRGVAMNVIDHPHGSSGGKTSGGRCSVTPWGKLTKGKKTNLKKKKNEII